MLKELFADKMRGESYEKTFYYLDTPLFNELTRVELRGIRIDPPGFDGKDLFQVQYTKSKINQDMNQPGMRYYNFVLVSLIDLLIKPIA
jgi:hypothetical protein